MGTSKRRIVLGGLVIAHVVGVTVVAWLNKFAYEPSLAVFLLAALIQVQVGLLATWAGFSTLNWPWRLLGTMIGAGWLHGIVPVGYYYAPLSGSRWLLWLVIVALPLLMILAVLVAVRRGGLTLRMTSTNDIAKAVGGLQFSILNVVLLTAVVAIALWIYQLIGRTGALLPYLFVFFIRFLPITLGAIWATLMARLSVWRFWTVALCWLLVGFVPFPFLTSIRLWGYPDFWEIPPAYLFDAPISMFLHMLIILGSFLVIRRCGYRLVRTTTC